MRTRPCSSPKPAGALSPVVPKTTSQPGGGRHGRHLRPLPEPGRGARGGGAAGRPPAGAGRGRCSRPRLLGGVCRPAAPDRTAGRRRHQAAPAQPPQGRGRGQGPRPGSERAARSARPPRAVARGPSVAWSPPRSPDAALTSAGVSDLLGHPQPARRRPGSGAALRVCLPNSFLPAGLEESVWKI